MSCEYMNAESTVCNIVESMLPTSTYERLGLQIKLDINAYDYGDEDTELYDIRSAWREIKFVFVRPSNYTQVYVTVRDNRDQKDSWTLQSDHDSCWRSDGLRSIFKCVQEVCRLIAPNQPFRKANPTVKISTFNGIQYVLLKERLGNDNIFGTGPRKLSYYYNRDNREVEGFEIEKTMKLKEALPYFQEKSCMIW